MSVFFLIPLLTQNTLFKVEAIMLNKMEFTASFIPTFPTESRSATEVTTGEALMKPTKKERG